MSVVGGAPASANLVTRVQNMLMKPAAEWDVIDGEAASVGSLFMGYACILAAIQPLAGIVSSLLFRAHADHPGDHRRLVLELRRWQLVGIFLIAFQVHRRAGVEFPARMEEPEIQALKCW